MFVFLRIFNGRLLLLPPVCPIIFFMYIYKAYMCYAAIGGSKRRIFSGKNEIIISNH